MINLIYASSAFTPMSEEELLDLLINARRKNTEMGVTGMLLYKSGNFLQVLEGEEAVVQSLFEEISNDRRHHDVMIIAKRPVTQRQFDGWSMAFSNLNLVNPAELPGYSKFLSEPFTPNEFNSKPSLAHNFLETFKELMR
jgi:hypothetical protein